MINDLIDQLKKELDKKNMIYQYEFHENGKHGFDVLNNDNRTKEIISKAFLFLKKVTGK